MVIFHCYVSSPEGNGPITMVSFPSRNSPSDFVRIPRIQRGQEAEKVLSVVLSIQPREAGSFQPHNMGVPNSWMVYKCL